MLIFVRLKKFCLAGLRLVIILALLSTSFFLPIFIVSHFKKEVFQNTKNPASVVSNFIESQSNTSSSNNIITSPIATTSATSSHDNLIMDIWWPLNNSSVNGIQPLKAVIGSRNIDEYTISWQVDGGNFTELKDNPNEYPHKEIEIDFSKWDWHGTGPYTLTLIGKDKDSNIISSKSLTLFISPSASEITKPISIPTIQTMSNTPFYVDPLSNAAKQAAEWALTRPTDAPYMAKIAAQPQAQWFGNWNSNMYNDVYNYVTRVSLSNSIPVLVAYNIPQRDCGGYSAGGANDAESYKQWIQNMALGIGDKKAWVILEPDSLAQSSCLNPDDLARRYELLNFAVTTLKTNPETSVYIDAGHANWIPAADMAQKLSLAGIQKADGFSLNVSNFISTESNASYGKELSDLLGGAHFVIDTGRNGAGDNGEWCNPSGRALGQKPTTETGNPLIDAYLWIKTPGESDGTCNGGPAAGTWWSDYALDLAKRASW